MAETISGATRPPKLFRPTKRYSFRQGASRADSTVTTPHLRLTDQAGSAQATPTSQQPPFQLGSAPSQSRSRPSVCQSYAPQTVHRPGHHQQLYDWRSISNQQVSVLYREPKLLKQILEQRAHVAEVLVSVLYREPKLLKLTTLSKKPNSPAVSVLYREPKLLK